jgi:hypothetical protein
VATSAMTSACTDPGVSDFGQVSELGETVLAASGLTYRLHPFISSRIIQAVIIFTLTVPIGLI